MNTGQSKAKKNNDWGDYIKVCFKFIKLHKKSGKYKIGDDI